MDKITHIVEYDVNADDTECPAVHNDRRRAGQALNAAEGVCLNSRKIKPLGLQCAFVPGPLAHRKSFQLPILIKPVLRTVVHAEKRPVREADIAGIDLLGIRKHCEHRRAQMRHQPEISGPFVVHACLAQDHDRRLPVLFRIRRQNLHGIQTVPVFNDTLRHGLQHVSLVDDFGKVIVRDVGLQLDRIDERALHHRVHGIPGDL